MQETANIDSGYACKPNDYFLNCRSEMVGFVPEDARNVLDVGCGGGEFGRLLKERGATVWGIEPSVAATDAGKHLDLVINSPFSINLPELREKQFDAVIFNDVLEHTVEPERLLTESKTLLRPNGVVVASIPNILFFPVMKEILIDEDWRYQEDGILDATHLRFFTRKSIVRMFEESGYRVDTVVGINPDESSRLYRLLNGILLGRLDDWKYLQYAVVARLDHAMESE